MNKETWVPIKDYEGIYEVSDTGRVRSLDRYVDLANGKQRNIKGKILSAKRNAEGYVFVGLCKDGIVRTRYVHRLVASAFIPNPGGLPEVNHLSGQKDDNTPANLQWCTHRDNVLHAYANGLTRNMGATHPFAAGVTDNILGQTFGTVREWCEARGIAYSTGRNLLNKTNKSKTIDLTGVVKISKHNDK